MNKKQPNLTQEPGVDSRQSRVHLTDKQSILLIIAVVLLVLTNLAVLLLLIQPGLAKGNPGTNSAHAGQSNQAAMGTETPSPSPTSLAELNPGSAEYIQGSSTTQGAVIFSMVEEGYSHLFTFTPGKPAMLRLTNSQWDDTDPALDPSGQRLAYASRQNGYWDIYVLDLQTGQTRVITDSPDYDSAPSWSPDSTRLVFQSYIGGNHELLIADISQEPVVLFQLTSNKAEDYDPAWSPDGKQIAYISTFNGSPCLWTAAISGSSVEVYPVRVACGGDPRHPTWSPDGTKLAWSELVNNRRMIVTWTFEDELNQPAPLTTGDYPAWSADATTIFHAILDPNQTYLTANRLPFGTLVYPVTPTSGQIEGLVWTENNVVANPPAWLVEKQNQPLVPMFQLAITPPVENLANRYQVVDLPNVKATYPKLHDLTDESFIALRERLKIETGWDVLASLENAFIPVSQVDDPNLYENWLYTGRAFALNTIPMNIDWMFISHEPYDNRDFFHVYVRPLYQDGSMGKPVLKKIWDINARFNSDPAAYETGGEELEDYPVGYWVDITDIALRYGWERVEAAPNWTTYYPGARYNILVLSSGLSWKDAMLELYPMEIFITPTPLVPGTQTPTPTIRLLRTSTPSRTPSPTSTPTYRPTWTPMPR